MQEEQQREITRLCARTALLLLSNGAESALVVGMTTRLGLALGAQQVECTLTVNAIVLTVIVDGYCLTTARRLGSMGINMTIVTAVQRTVLSAEAGRLDCQQVHKLLDKVPQSRYPAYLTVSMVALSCACFARLSGADILSCTITFLAAFFGMIVRVKLEKKHLNALMTFSATAFVATLLAGFFQRLGWSHTPQTMMAAAVLMLVPGFPLINSLSDGLKGYMNMGVGRWMWATVLTLAACLGIIFALLVLGLDAKEVLL
ncbi:threonine/serine exporter family protein [Suttonella ornithocola]|uniref:Inner membrane protein YjjP n=1 Tax=Suttonella ornithocola TaxID=279832 RepID=A0A380MRM2_9GAMM|nr:threonine/serine exporter family protein [Suttonella ornithocola]SUO93977.1 Inner membrane protein YjjP [Suttonella ornithocola]